MVCPRSHRRAYHVRHSVHLLMHPGSTPGQSLRRIQGTFSRTLRKSRLSRLSLRKIAWILLVFSQSIDLSGRGRITRQEIEYAVDHRIRYAKRPKHTADSRRSRLLFIHVATEWLRFMGRLEEPPCEPKPLANYPEH